MSASARRVWLSGLLAGAALLAWGAAASADGGADTVSLAWKWTKGQKLHYHTVMNLDQSVTAGKTPPRSFRIVEDMTITLEVADVADDGAARVISTTEAMCVTFTGSMAGLDATYDSRRPEDATKTANPVLAPMIAILGEPVEYGGHGPKLRRTDDPSDEVEG